MELFRKMKIGSKLGLGFGAVLTLMIVLGIFSLVELSKLNGCVLDIGNNWMASVTDLSQLRYDTSKVRRYELNTFLQADKSPGIRQIDTTISEIDKDEKTYEPTISSDQERNVYQSFRAAWDKHVAVKDRYVELLHQGKEKEAKDLLLSEGLSTFGAADKFLDDDVQLNNAGAIAAMKTSAEVYSAAHYLVIGLLLGAIVLGAGVAFTLARSISRAAIGMLDMIQEVADNNLALEDMEISSEDEVGQAGIALNRMKNNLHTMVHSMRGTAEQVAAASAQLSATSQQITANSEETTAQAKTVSDAGASVNTNLQTLSSGAEEMNATIGEIAKNATEAARVAGEAVSAAEAANSTVNRLGESSAEIGKVVEVITSIAQQTNLLALNATIEAARAGEAGKGFAVVANEVKELAKQTAKATEEIKGKISVIQETTTGAVNAIGGIREVIDKISSISTTIATAVEEQSATTGEMARNVSEAARGAATIASNISGVAQAAQDTSTNVGDAQKATEHLSGMASELRELVGQFKIGSGGNESHASAPPPRARAAAAH